MVEDNKRENTRERIDRQYREYIEEREWYEQNLPSHTLPPLLDLTDFMGALVNKQIDEMLNRK